MLCEAGTEANEGSNPIYLSSTNAISTQPWGKGESILLLCGGFHDCSSTAGCSAHPVGMAASAPESWIGLLSLGYTIRYVDCIIARHWNLLFNTRQSWVGGAVEAILIRTTVHMCHVCVICFINFEIHKHMFKKGSHCTVGLMPFPSVIFSTSHSSKQKSRAAIKRHFSTRIKQL